MRRGTRVGQAYVAITADGDGINEEIVNSVDEAGPGVEKAGDEHGKRYGDHFSEGFLSRMRGKVRKRFSSELSGAGDDAGKAFTERFESHFDDKYLDRLGARAGGHLVDALNFAMSKEGGENPLSRLFDRWMNEAVSGNGVGRKRNKGLTGIDDWLRGTRFRNNAINILAKSMGGLVRGFELVGIGAKNFVTNMKNAEEGASLFSKIGAGFGMSGAEGASGISKAFSSIAASGPGAAVAIVAVGVGMSILVSVANALLAIVVALAATIASALVGALAVGGGAILAMVAAGGLLVNAFMSMTDAQKKFLKDAFLPLKSELTGLGQIMLRDMVPAFSTWSTNLQKALMQAVPVAQVMGRAFAQAGNSLTASLSGPGFQMFSQALATYLPNIITRLSAALGSFLNGTLGMFSAIMPYVNQFAGYLADVAERFSAWATSAKGQNAISDFVARALVSLKSLWSFLGAVGSLISTVLFSSAGQNAGNNIFDSMTRAVRRFTTYLSQDDRMEKWFAQGVVFAKSLGQAIKTVAQVLQSLNESGVIDGIARMVDIGAGSYQWWSKLPGVIQGMLFPLKGVADFIGWIGDKIGASSREIGSVIGNQSQINAWGAAMLGPLGSVGAPKAPSLPKISMPSLQSLGLNALNNTSVKSGGFKKPKKYHNPWVKWANSLIKDGPSVSAQIKNAILSMNKAAASGIMAASRATSSGDVASAMESLVSSIQTTGAQTVNTAQSALNTAAQSLANATSKGAAKRALKQVRKSQRDLRAALADQTRINRAAAILNAQRVVSEPRVQALLSGIAVTNATLADYAEARSRVADLLNDANQKLTTALQLRDQYKSQVADSIKSFGSLLSAQAQSIDGVEQALTANDITSNLQDRLAKIKAFQNDLRLLLAQGLSNDAYKQIVDAGVDQGSTFAEALLAGGNGSIQNVNSLVGQINGIADTLGTETSSRLYQAGVDAAQGLVDGLTSLSAQLDAAALRLGNSIALAVKRSLGIASPSRVLRSMMDDVGDGAVLGLGDQHVKVGTAAAALASKIAVNPSGTYSSTAAAASAGVSGNGSDQKFRDLVVNTPTEDPHAVAMEVLNEVTGRL